MVIIYEIMNNLAALVLSPSLFDFPELLTSVSKQLLSSSGRPMYGDGGSNTVVKHTSALWWPFLTEQN